MEENIRTLLIEDDESDAFLLEEYLSDVAGTNFDVIHVDRLAKAEPHLEKNDIDIVLLDLSLPDSHGLETFDKVKSQSAEVPVIVLTGNDDDSVAVKAVQNGAQDFLVKGQVDSKFVVRAIRYAIERSQLLKELEEARQIDHFRATHDDLTGLPNRQLFYDRLHQAIVHAQRYKHHFGVLYLDLDGFKFINDNLGHNIGDKLLQQVANRLLGSLRGSDTVARLGGDEFIVILSRIAEAQDAVKVGQKLTQALSKDFQIGGHALSVTASMGISLYPTDGEDVGTLVKNADVAMYRAKKEGKNKCLHYDATLGAKFSERLTLENNLHQSIKKGELVVYYQPQMNLQTGAIMGVEALTRWQHPEIGLVPPVKFIPIAERTGFMLKIDEWVLRTACQQIKSWHSAGFDTIRASVNLAATKFQERTLPEILSQILQETNLDPRFLILEITENIAKQDVKFTIEMLRKLKELGVLIAVHQFGKDYSSLSYLKHVPMDILKVDRSFIGGLPSSPEDAKMIHAILALGHSLDLEVIAEGVETKEQIAFLIGQRCHEIQGYYIYPPEPAEQISKLLKSGWQLGDNPMINKSLDRLKNSDNIL